MKVFSRVVLLLLMCCTTTGRTFANDNEDKAPVTIFAAASLTNVLPELAAAWRTENAAPAPYLSFGPSAMMARQVAAGAPADIVLSANPDWISFLEGRDLLSGPARIMAKNRLVLVKPGSGQTSSTALDTAILTDIVGHGRFAIAAPATAPAGQLLCLSHFLSRCADLAKIWLCANCLKIGR